MFMQVTKKQENVSMELCIFLWCKCRSITTEAEYVALSEVVKELKFMIQLLETMKIQVEISIAVCVDNIGAIWLSNN